MENVITKTGERTIVDRAALDGPASARLRTSAHRALGRPVAPIFPPLDLVHDRNP